MALALVLALLWRRPALLGQVLIADLAADGLAYVLKQSIDRPRPPEVYRTPRPLVHVPHEGSFPSGHAATAFACATLLSWWAPRYTPAFALLAVAIGFSRVYVGVHWPLDVLGGALLGVATATLLVLVTRRWRLGAEADCARSTATERGAPPAR